VKGGVEGGLKVLCSILFCFVVFSALLLVMHFFFSSVWVFFCVCIVFFFFVLENTESSLLSIICVFFFLTFFLSGISSMGAPGWSRLWEGRTGWPTFHL
jgi:hypothetical protein